MRNLIEAVQIFKQYVGVHFYGTPDKRLSIDPIAGTLFSDLDTACEAGKNIYECEISLRNAFMVDSEADFEKAMLAVGHERTYDGVVFARGAKVVVFDEDAVEVVSHFEAECRVPRTLDEADIVHEFAPKPGQHIVLVTGQLAARGLERVMKALGDVDFTYEVRVIDIAVAAWLTTDRIADELTDLEGVDAVVIPGKVTGDEAALADALGVPVLRGPGCYSEIPAFLEREGIEVEVEGNVRPKIVVLSDDPTHARLLASTYEVPLINRQTIEAELDGESFDDAHHNVIAEAVRALLVSLKKGFVLNDYPRIERDVRWLSEIVTPDIVIGVGHHPLADLYENEPVFVRVALGDSVAERLVTVVEKQMQSCIFNNQQTIQRAMK